ncbi:hypothetical protein CRUP_030271, partial [Coryphaenoides rupestris]
MMELYTDQLYTDQLCTDQLCTDQLYTDQLYTDQLFTDQLYTDQLFTDQLYTDQLYTDQLYTGQLCTDQLYTGQLCTDQLYTDQLYTDQLYTDQLYTDQLFTDQVYMDQLALHPALLLHPAHGHDHIAGVKGQLVVMESLVLELHQHLWTATQDIVRITPLATLERGQGRALCPREEPGRQKRDRSTGGRRHVVREQSSPCHASFAPPSSPPPPPGTPATNHIAGVKGQLVVMESLVLELHQHLWTATQDVLLNRKPSEQNFQ